MKYGAWFGLNGQPWCVMYVMWSFDQAGVSLPVRTASCTVLMNAAKSADMWVTGAYRPGDVVIYDWGGDRVPDHCGIVESVSGAVMRRVRTAGQILGAVRPVFQEEKKMDNTPTEAHRDGVAWAVANGILQGTAEGDLMLSQPVTRQQMCTMLQRLVKLMEQKYR